MSRPAKSSLRSAAPYLVATLWMALGWAFLVRGVEHPGVAYRPWAFRHHAYSDLLSMTGDRYLNGGRPLPYLEDPVEYPVLLGVALWAPSFLPGGQVVHFTASVLGLWLCLLAALAILSRLPGASPWWLAGTPALAYYGALKAGAACVCLNAMHRAAELEHQVDEAQALAGVVALFERKFDEGA